MGSSSRRRDVSSVSSICRVLAPTLAIGLFLQTVGADSPQAAIKRSDKGLLHFPGRISAATRREPDDSDRPIPLTITNKCGSTIWPGIATQAGKGPGTGGFALSQGKSKDLWVSSDWQGRVWGRTNCTVNGDSCSCKTGDCFGKLDCESSVSTLHKQAMYNSNGNRAPHQRLWPSLLWLAVWKENRPSMISHW